MVPPHSYAHPTPDSCAFAFPPHNFPHSEMLTVPTLCQLLAYKMDNGVPYGGRLCSCPNRGYIEGICCDREEQVDWRCPLRHDPRSGFDWHVRSCQDCDTPA